MHSVASIEIQIYYSNNGIYKERFNEQVLF